MTEWQRYLSTVRQHRRAAQRLGGKRLGSLKGSLQLHGTVGPTPEIHLQGETLGTEAGNTDIKLADKIPLKFSTPSHFGSLPTPAFVGSTVQRQQNPQTSNCVQDFLPRWQCLSQTAQTCLSSKHRDTRMSALQCEGHHHSSWTAIAPAQGETGFSTKERQVSPARLRRTTLHNVASSLRPSDFCTVDTLVYVNCGRTGWH